MRTNRSSLILAVTAVATAASLLVSGCATPATPASVAAAAQAAANPPAALPTSATAGNSTIVAVQPAAAPPAPQCTLCGFLGIDKAGACAGGLLQRLFSRIKTALGLEGRFPGLQPVPPVLPITDPANLGPTSPPAVKAAAQAKMEEDQSAQKIQALRYLAKIGCGGCYPGIEEAMLAALDDCTEEVRYEALLALRGNGNVCCAYCRCHSCCSPAVRKKLDALANDRDDAGCFREPSERVRRLARVVLGACGGLVLTEEAAPSEGPTPAPPPDAAVPGSSAARGAKQEETLLMPAVQLVSFDEESTSPSLHDTVLARVNGEEILESRVVPLIEAESARRRAKEIIVGPDQFQALLVEQVRRAVDAKLLLQQAHRELTAAGRPFGPLTSDEADEWLKKALNVDPYVSLLELNAYYRSHSSKFQGPAEVRWEQITIWVKEAPSRQKALDVAEYVRERAAGKTDVPTDVDLRLAQTKTVPHTPLNRVEQQVLVPALKSLPVGTPSAVIENGDELFVVRVLDRRPGPLTSFDEAAGIIRAEIMAARRRKAEQDLLARLRQGAEVWTTFDAPAAPAVPPLAKPIVAEAKLASVPPVVPEMPLPTLRTATPVPTPPPSPTIIPPATPWNVDPRSTPAGVQPQIIKFNFPDSDDSSAMPPSSTPTVPFKAEPIPLPPVSDAS